MDAEIEEAVTWAQAGTLEPAEELERFVLAEVQPPVVRPAVVRETAQGAV